MKCCEYVPSFLLVWAQNHLLSILSSHLRMLRYLSSQVVQVCEQNKLELSLARFFRLEPTRLNSNLKCSPSYLNGAKIDAKLTQNNSRWRKMVQDDVNGAFPARSTWPTSPRSWTSVWSTSRITSWRACSSTRPEVSSKRTKSFTRSSSLALWLAEWKLILHFYSIAKSQVCEKVSTW